MIKADLEKKLDDCITFLLCSQTEEGEEGTQMMDEADTLFTREDDMEIEEDDMAPREDDIPNKTDGDTSDDDELTSLPGSSAHGEVYMDEDFTKLIVEPKIIPQRVPDATNGVQSFKYTETELDTMAGFLIEQGLIHKNANVSD